MAAMQDPVIRFNRASLTGRETEYMLEAVREGHISGDGPFTKRCQSLLENVLGAQRVLLTTSCTHALEMSALLLDLAEGDEVVVPSFTFVSTVNAYVLRRACPVFIDVRPDTLNLDETRLEALLSPRTRAIAPVHYAGVGCEMDSIAEIAADRGIEVVEDNAHGLLGRYRGRYLGTFGGLATLSFHETKNFTCGEGGALIVNDGRYAERAEILREKGTDRARFFRGEIDKYNWVDLGSSYVPSDLLAAFLLAQLESREQIQEQRRRVWTRYQAGLSSWAMQKNVSLPQVPDHCEQSYHMFYMLCPSLDKRQELITRLKEKGIWSVFHYQPLHLSPMGRRWGYREGDLPVTERVADRLIRLPFHNELEPSAQDRICQAIVDATASW